MPGELIGDTVKLEDEAEASQIYNKGFFGYPQSGGGIELDLMEAAYLIESGKLEVERDNEKITFSSLSRSAFKINESFQVQYIVYRDLRQRGYVAKTYSGEFDFRVFPRGGTPTSSETKYWVLTFSERSIFDISTLLDKLNKADRKRKELLLAVVDEEGDITYYRASEASPKGYAGDLGEGRPEGLLVEDRAVIFDQYEDLYHAGFFGKEIGNTLQLSLIETAFLMSNDRLTLRNGGTGRRLSLNGLKRRAEELQPDFDLRLRTYRDLRTRGMVVKTGFKYGCHFRVYQRNPDETHARFLVHAVPMEYETFWPEISRAVRLAHGVKKEILFGQVCDDTLRYLRLERVRP